MAELADRCLEAVNACHIVAKYVDLNCDVQSGQVANAIATHFSQEYSKFLQQISDLECRQKSVAGLSLAQLSFELHAQSTTIRELSNLANAISDLHGCALLIALESLQKKTVGTSLHVIDETLSAARAPIHRMIASWIMLGDLHDPYGDFFVKLKMELPTQRHSSKFSFLDFEKHASKNNPTSNNNIRNTNQPSFMTNKSVNDRFKLGTHLNNQFLDGVDAHRRPRVRAARRTRALSKENQHSNFNQRDSSYLKNGEPGSPTLNSSFALRGGSSSSSGEILSLFASRGVWLDEAVVPESLRDLASKIMQTGKYIAMLELVRPYLEEALEKMMREEEEGRRGGAEVRKEIRALLSKGSRVVNKDIDESFILTSVKGIGHDLIKLKEVVESAHDNASRTVLKVFVEAFDLKAVIESSVHFFLLRWSDFFDQFLITAADEIKLKPNKHSLSRLQKLLAAEFRNSTASIDKNVDLFSLCCLELTCKEVCNILSDNSAKTSEFIERIYHEETMNALHDKTRKPSKVSESISLCMETPAPLRVLFTPVAIIKYQTLFRHIAACKMTDSLLARAWTILQPTRTVTVRRAGVDSALALRARMSHFIRSYLSYLTTSVVERQWSKLSSVLESASTIDEILVEHEVFLNSILTCSLLTVGAETLQSWERATSITYLFAENVLRFCSNCIPTPEEIAAQINGKYPPIAPSQMEAASANVQGQDDEKSWRVIGGLALQGGRRRHAKAALEANCLADRMSDEKFVEMVQKFRYSFDAYLNNFLKLLQGHARAGLGDDSALESLLFQLTFQKSKENY